MKKLFFSLAVIAISFAASAQTSKGTYLLGGTAGFQSQDDVSTITVAPRIGYFLADNLAAGLGLGYTKIEDLSMWSLDPFIRYYALGIGDNAKIFGQASYSYGSMGEDLSTSGWGVGAGAAFFLNESIALEVGLNYGSTTVGDADATSALRFGAGFQIHFGK